MQVYVEIVKWMFSVPAVCQALDSGYRRIKDLSFVSLTILCLFFLKIYLFMLERELERESAWGERQERILNQIPTELGARHGAQFHNPWGQEMDA